MSYAYMGSSSFGENLIFGASSERVNGWWPGCESLSSVELRVHVKWDYRELRARGPFVRSLGSTMLSEYSRGDREGTAKCQS